MLVVLLALLLGGQPALAVACCPEGEPATASAAASAHAVAQAADAAAEAAACCPCVGVCAGGCSHAPASGLHATAARPSAPLAAAVADLRAKTDAGEAPARPPGLERPPRA